LAFVHLPNVCVFNDFKPFKGFQIGLCDNGDKTGLTTVFGAPKTCSLSRITETNGIAKNPEPLNAGLG
jgi:hypothetical protein